MYTFTVARFLIRLPLDHAIKLDPQFESLLNEKNWTDQSGYLVVEPLCEHAVKQRDTLEEGACDGYEGHIFNGKMNGRHVSITGSYAEDMEHGWCEIHPVTSMDVIKRTKKPTFEKSATPAARPQRSSGPSLTSRT